MTVKDKVLEAKAHFEALHAPTNVKPLRPINVYVPQSQVKIKFVPSPWGYRDALASIAMASGFIALGFCAHAILK